MDYDCSTDETNADEVSLAQLSEIQRSDAVMRLVKLKWQLAELHESISCIANVDHRAVGIARTELQSGFMWLTRAVNKPDGGW